MAITNREIVTLIRLRDEATAQWQKFENEVALGGRRISSLFSTLGPVIGAAFGVAGISEFIQKSNSAEQTTAKLTAALSAQGITSPQVTNEMLDYSKAMQSVTTFDDDAVTGTQALIVSMTGLTGKAVQPLTKAALDLSAGLDIDAESAARLIAKTAGGSDALGRYGISIGKTVSESERLEKITKAVEERFGGMAEAAAGTNAGKLKQFQNQLDNLEESFGDIIKTVLASVMPGLQALADWLVAAPPEIQAMVLALGALAAAFVALGISISPVSLAIAATIAVGTGLVAAFSGMGDSTEKLTEDFRALHAEGEKLKDIGTLADRYDMLSGKANLNAKEHAELVKIIGTLADFMPSAISAFDNEGKAVGIDTDAIRENAEARRQYLLLKEKDFIQNEVIDPLAKAADQYRFTSDAIETGRKRLSEWRSTLAQVQAGIPGVTGNVEALQNHINITTQFISEQNGKLVENRSRITDLIGVLSLYVKNIKDFGEVEPVLKQMGIEGKALELLRSQWGSLVSGIKDADSTQSKLSRGTEYAAGTLGAMQKIVTDLGEELKRLVPKTDAYIAKQKELQEAQEKVKKATAEIFDEKSLAGMQGAIALLTEQQSKVDSNSAAYLQLGIQIAAIQAAIEKIKSPQIELVGPVEPDSFAKEQEAERVRLHKAALDQMAEDSVEILTNDKERELEIVTQWEKKASDTIKADKTLSAEETQTELDRITKIGTERRTQIELNAIKRTVAQASGLLKQGISTLGQFTAQHYQERLDEVDGEKEKALAAIDAKLAAENLSEEERKKLLAQRAALEANYAQQEREIKRQAFEADKEQRVIMAIIDTASAVVEALPDIPLSILVGILGAAQVALIASQPTPKFHEGTGNQSVAEKIAKAPATREFPILVRGGETIRTEEQEKAMSELVLKAQTIINERATLARFHDGGAVGTGISADVQSLLDAGNISALLGKLSDIRGSLSAMPKTDADIAERERLQLEAVKISTRISDLQSRNIYEAEFQRIQASGGDVFEEQRAQRGVIAGTDPRGQNYIGLLEEQNPFRSPLEYYGPSILRPFQPAAVRTDDIIDRPGRGGTVLNFIFNTPVPNGQWVVNSVREHLRLTGQTADQVFINTRNRLTIKR